MDFLSKIDIFTLLFRKLILVNLMCNFTLCFLPRYFIVVVVVVIAQQLFPFHQ